MAIYFRACITTHKKTPLCGAVLTPEVLLSTNARMRWSVINFTWSDDAALYRLHRYKRAAAIDICTLVIALFSIFTEIGGMVVSSAGVTASLRVLLLAAITSRSLPTE